MSGLPRRALLLAPLLLPSRPAGAAVADDAAALAQVMRGLAAVRERRSTFTEEKALPELDLPLASQGTLAWRAPDRLEKHTEWPIEERLTVVGSRLAYERPDRGIRRDFALEEQPEMQALVEAIRGTLAGDLSALRRHYRIGFATGRDGAWRLELVPLSMRLLGAVQRIVLTGMGSDVQGMDTEGHGGTTRLRVTGPR